MTLKYNPIVRNFCRIRRVLMETLELPRDAIHPSATLVELIPRSQRRRVWKAFDRENLNAVELRLSRGQWFASAALMLLWVSTGCWAWPGSWCTFLGSAPFLGLAVSSVLFRFCATEIDRSLTIGDAVLRATSGRQCTEADYRFTRNEIFLKVRQIVASSLGVNPSQIRPETNLMDDLGA
jgi:hypothetical protein